MDKRIEEKIAELTIEYERYDKEYRELDEQINDKKYKDYMELQNLKEEKLESFYQKTKLEDELKKLREQRNNSYRETLNIEKELLMLKLRKKI